MTLTLMDLVAKWRRVCAHAYASGNFDGTQQGFNFGLDSCADELEALVREWDKRLDVPFSRFFRQEILGTEQKE